MDTQHTEENNNVLEPPGVPLQARGAVHARSRSFRAVILMLMAYGISVALYHTISESLPEVVCQLPVVSSYSPICVRELDRPRTPVINPDFITLSRLQSRLEDVLEDSASSPMAADCIKGSARDLRDLVGRVKRSSLVRKDILGKELERFVEDAKEASKSLRELGSRVWGVTDQIISFNDRILVILDVSGRPFSSVVNFLMPIGRETADIHRRRMEGIWFEAIKLLKGNIGSLIHQTEHNVDLLQRLEKRLVIVQDMTDEEEENTQNEERESKRQWSWFQDEKKSEARSDRLKLIQEIRGRRQRALDEVMGMLSVLNDISSELKDLGENVGVPITAAGLSSIPIEVYIKSIRSSTDRLLHGQTRAREIKDANRKKKLCHKLYPE